MLPPTGIGGMHYHERQMLLFFVGVCALAAHLVGAAQLAVIGCKDHNCRAIQAVVL